MTTNSGGSSQFYSLYFQVRELLKQPVAVTLLSSTNADGAQSLYYDELPMADYRYGQ